MTTDQQTVDEPITTAYESVRASIRTGDLGLVRNGGAIAATQDGPWTHAFKCYKIDGTLFAVEVREFFGGRIVTLSSQIRAYQGRIDIFRPTCSRELAELSTRFLARHAGHVYGWRSVARAFAMRANLVRLLIDWNPDTTDTTPSDWYEPKDCSQAVIWADRMAALDRCQLWDPVPRLGDRYVTPTHLGHSAAYDGLFYGLTIKERPRKPDAWRVFP